MARPRAQATSKQIEGHFYARGLWWLARGYIRNANFAVNCMPSPQARYWLLTIPHADFLPYLPPGVAYIRGQLESAPTTGYLHWQVMVAFKRKLRLGGLKELFGTTVHAEPSRSDAATEYVWKDDTAVEGTRFELGKRAVDRGNPVDWEGVRLHAKLLRLLKTTSGWRMNMI